MAEMHGAGAVELELFPQFFERPTFPESAPTFAENAAGKALHYSRFTELPVMADDSGLEVAALGGAPGVHSARYAGAEASQAQRNAKLQEELRRVSMIARGGKKSRSRPERAIRLRDRRGRTGTRRGGAFGRSDGRNCGSGRVARADSVTIPCSFSRPWEKRSRR